MSLRKILLIDDDDAVNFLNRKKLKEFDPACEVIEAIDGQEALNYLAGTDQCPDVILLDLNMPGVDGFGFLKKYAEQGKCCNESRVFVFIVTSSLREEDKVKAVTSGLVNGYFEKPLSENQIRIIQRLFQS
jgi:CheY-like chemotaxis protein